MFSKSPLRGLLILALQVGLIVMLVGAGWFVYRQLPEDATEARSSQGTTAVQIIIRQPPEGAGPVMDIVVTLYRIDFIAVKHEYFTEPRAGKRFEDFIKERMKSPVNARLDKQGQGSVMLAPGSWWLVATLSGDEQLEWRLPVTVTGAKQVIELTPQNAYTRSKTF